MSQVLNQLQDLRKVSGTHRESVVREAFKDLLKGWARSHDLVFIPEYEIETRAKNRRYVDGALLYEPRCIRRGGPGSAAGSGPARPRDGGRRRTQVAARPGRERQGCPPSSEEAGYEESSSVAIVGGGLAQRIRNLPGEARPYWLVGRLRPDTAVCFHLFRCS
jgi:hypothetical protein